MPSATITQALASVEIHKGKRQQLLYLCFLFAALNESCREKSGITYSSTNLDNHRVLTPFQVFLCKLAQICDNEKGGDTITALVALKAANGPGYLFASNSRKATELKDTKEFLGGLLNFVGKNPDGITDKTLKKQALFRILEFNLPKVKFCLKQVVTAISECIKQCASSETPGESEILLQLRQIEARANFSTDMSSGTPARVLSDCEALIRTIQSAILTGFSKVMNERASVGDSGAAHPWCELRHHLGRLHSYRQAADTIVGASKTWPELFTDFTVAHIPSSGLARLSLPRPTLSPMDMITAAFPDMDVEAYAGHIEHLQEYGLDQHIREKLEQKFIRQAVHCEVLLEDFLVRGEMVKAYDYWNNSMFIATSKPPCRLCRYYFDDPGNDFLVQSSHMNVYPKWRLPDIYEGQGEDVFTRQESLLEDIIEQMQQDVLRLIREQQLQWKRNDSSTESWAGQSIRLNGHGERSDTRTSGRITSMSGTSGQVNRGEGHGFDFASSSGDHDYVDIALAR